MRAKLQIKKDGAALYECVHDISDADSFGRACAQAWTQLRAQRLEKTTSIGALFDALDEQLLDDLFGAEISLSKA